MDSAYLFGGWHHIFADAIGQNTIKLINQQLMRLHLSVRLPTRVSYARTGLAPDKNKVERKYDPQSSHNPFLPLYLQSIKFIHVQYKKSLSELDFSYIYENAGKQWYHFVIQSVLINLHS